MKRAIGALLIAVMAVLSSCDVGGGPQVSSPLESGVSSTSEAESIVQNQEEAMGLKLTSSAFNEGALIPKQYTCDGQDISPPLAWTGAPEGTRSWALICDDPDAPVGVWDHWVLFNVPTNVMSLPEAVSREENLSIGGTHGRNSWGKVGYGGPCPPGGTHRYIFRLYALDADLNLKAGVSKKDVEKAMAGHILAETQLMGKYERS